MTSGWPDGTRLTLLNREFNHRRGATVLERIEMADPNHLLEILDTRFGLRLPAGTPLRFPAVTPTG